MMPPKIRTSEDVRASYEDILRFIVLAQHFARCLMQPLLLFACLDSYACPDLSRANRKKLTNIFKCKNIIKPGAIFWENAQCVHKVIKTAIKSIFSFTTPVEIRRKY